MESNGMVLVPVVEGPQEGSSDVPSVASPQEVIANASAPAKKRGRGRPRKVKVDAKVESKEETKEDEFKTEDAPEEEKIKTTCGIDIALYLKCSRSDLKNPFKFVHWFSKQLGLVEFDLFMFKHQLISLNNTSNKWVKLSYDVVTRLFGNLDQKQEDAYSHFIRSLNTKIKQKVLDFEAYNDKTQQGNILIAYREHPLIQEHYGNFKDLRANRRHILVRSFMIDEIGAVITMQKAAELVMYRRRLDAANKAHLKHVTDNMKLERRLSKLSLEFARSRSFVEGEIYVGACPSDLERFVVKIGRTADATNRKRQYRTGYSSESQFVMFGQFKVRDPVHVEASIKKYLAPWRMCNSDTNRKNEMFNLPKDYALKMVEKICNLSNAFDKALDDLYDPDCIAKIAYEQKYA